MTKANIVYSVSFDITLYSNYLDSYPCLLHKGYGFGFFPEKPEGCNRIPHDKMIAQTIMDIASDFITNQSEDVFLLYHCESHDGRQAFRHKLFDKWYLTSDHNDKMIKYGLEVEIKRDSGEKEYHYIGFITKHDNKNVIDAIIELEQFSVDLVNESTNKNH